MTRAQTTGWPGRQAVARTGEAVGPHDQRPADPRVARSRQRVLAAALDLLTERGIAGATIEAIAARSGVAKTTIYRQWPHQAALVLDAFRSAAPDPPATDTGSLRDDLIILLSGLAKALTSSPAGLLLPALIDAASRDTDFAILHADEARRRHQPVLAVLERACRRDELPQAVDLPELVDRLAGPVLHRRYVSGLPLHRGFIEHVVDAALQLP